MKFKDHLNERFDEGIISFLKWLFDKDVSPAASREEIEEYLVKKRNVQKEQAAKDAKKYLKWGAVYFAHKRKKGKKEEKAQKWKEARKKAKEAAKQRLQKVKEKIKK